ncbi:hypothetical protein SAMN04487983_101393 [Streptomyces sp. yr375]|nr:hypothetical protein SAMN04487983_101393 [Streptomyces sp. yr375]
MAGISGTRSGRVRVPIVDDEPVLTVRGLRHAFMPMEGRR